MARRPAIVSRTLAPVSRIAFIAIIGLHDAGIVLSAPEGDSRVSIITGNLVSWHTAVFVFGLVLAAVRGIPQQMAALRQGRWQTMLGVTLRGRTLGILGYGRIGATVAGYGKAFGMNVLTWGREGSIERARADGIETVDGKEVLFEQSDVLSVHLRSNKSTQGLITAADLARMKPASLFVNTSRAAIVEPGALEAALRNGRPGSAAVDVYEEEPVLGGNHPLLKMDNVIVSSHVASASPTAARKLRETAANLALAALNGEPLSNIVNGVCR